MQLSKIDLNLLPALAALLEERSVTRAAESVGISQSAMSRTLGRLRRLLEDELLIRIGDSYHLTPAAEVLQTQLLEILPQLQSIFLEREFDPTAETRQFRIAGSDYAVATFGVALAATVLKGAPKSSVRYVPWHNRIVEELADGELDIVFSGLCPPRPFVSELLFTDDVICVVDSGHPLAGRTSITLDEYLSFGHIIIDIVDGGQPVIDRVLAAKNRPREAALTVPFHSMAPLALQDSQLILSIPSRSLQHFVAPFGKRVSTFPAPLNVSSLPYFMTWHSRAEHDKGARWLRERARQTTGSSADVG